ncbi:MAG: tRNA 5-methoxyuridine(34)/uridine 5-oxyacetic acid(34) synthase CmoB [Candidatus Thioglobus sp.]|nr:tRNA 5-methoxyuridine(34)/uridine 5-oxyacetic acid(34) synthase CmoB [Candidatus Thioglobus sp.]
MLDAFSQHCKYSKIQPICLQLRELSEKSLSAKNGNIAKWHSAIEQIKSQPKGNLSFSEPYLNIDSNLDNNKLQSALKQLLPWRKGPYQLGDLRLESEWNGAMKWARIAKNIQPLTGKTVLDVGAGNGYFSYLMALAGAKTVLGIEPFLLFYYQFQAIRTLILQPPPAFILPLRLEQMPDAAAFDSVFSMGVLYHQKDHLAHLQKLRQMMTNDAELILETLVIEEKYGKQIIPENRYAKMRNVHCLPSFSTLEAWLLEAGFGKIRLINISKTTPKEQNSTAWIGENAESLKDFLDPNNSNLTIEGLPAPQRAILICSKNP